MNSQYPRRSKSKQHDLHHSDTEESSFPSRIEKFGRRRKKKKRPRAFLLLQIILFSFLSIVITIIIFAYSMD